MTREEAENAIEIWREPYYTISQITEILGVSKWQVYKRLIDFDEHGRSKPTAPFPNAYKISDAPNSEVRVPQSDVNAYMIRRVTGTKRPTEWPEEAK